MTHKGNGLTLVNGEGNIIQNRMLPIIRKTHMFKPNIAFLDFDLPIFLKGLISRLVNQGKDTTCRNHRRLKGRKILRHFNQGIKETIDILDKGIHSSCRYSQIKSTIAKIGHQDSIT